MWLPWVDDPFAQAVADVTAADLMLALEQHLSRFLRPSDPKHGYGIVVAREGTEGRRVGADPGPGSAQHAAVGAGRVDSGRVTVVTTNAANAPALLERFQAGPHALAMQLHAVQFP